MGIIELISLTDRRVMQSYRAIVLRWRDEPETLKTNDCVGGARLLGGTYWHLTTEWEVPNEVEIVYHS